MPKSKHKETFVSAPQNMTLIVDGEEKQVNTGTTGAELFFERRDVVVMRVDGVLKDLDQPLSEDAKIESVTIDSPDGLNVLRHSTAHVMAQAVQQLRPDAKLGIGPYITDGFYFDFDVEEPFTPDDLKTLEKMMLKIVNQNQKFARRVVTEDEARAAMADEPYKLILLDKSAEADEAGEGVNVEVGAGEITIYDNVDRKSGDTVWCDLCRGPHLPNTKLISNAFALTRSAAAYWLGNEKNKQLQRIYGTAWPTKDDLKAYQERLAEAERRDHRKLGAEMDLFSFPDELGSGLPVFHPRGGIIRKEMEEESGWENWYAHAGRDWDRIILGGEDHRKEIPMHKKSMEELLEYAEELFGKEYPVVRTWSGPIEEPIDGLAYIGEYDPRRIVATAFSGNGMTYAALTAMIARDIVTGKKNPYAELYKPGRTPSLKQLWKKGRDYTEEFFRGAVANALD